MRRETGRQETGYNKTGDSDTGGRETGNRKSMRQGNRERQAGRWKTGHRET